MTELYTNSIRLHDIVFGTSVDGPGLRTSIYGAGCEHHCPGCHNPQTWDPAGGTLRNIDEVADLVVAEEMDVTFSGGDPMYQPFAFARLAKAIKRRANLDIWCYTGYRIEQIVRVPKLRWLLDEVDVLVDGRFVESEKDLSLLFRGSANQRIIDVKASLSQGEVVMFEQFCRDYDQTFVRPLYVEK